MKSIYRLSDDWPDFISPMADPNFYYSLSFIFSTWLIKTPFKYIYCFNELVGENTVGETKDIFTNDTLLPTDIKKKEVN